MGVLMSNEFQLPSGSDPKPPAHSVLALSTEFFETLHYELRTPLTSIIGFTEILIEDSEDLGAAVMVPDLQKILKAARDLLAIVDRTLDLEAFRQEHSDKALETVVSTLRHDLLSPLNAVIGYSEILLEDAADQACKSLIPDLQRIHTAAGDLQGLIRSILTLTQPDPVETVPTSPPGEADPAESVPAVAPAILIGDDNPLNRALLARFLRQQGLNVTTAEHGRQVLEMMAAAPFDLLLLDMKMPEMDGTQVLTFLKQSETLRHIPVIMISAMNDFDKVVSCIELGAEDYLPLPLNRVFLMARINASLEKKRLRDLDARRLHELAATVEKLRLSEEKALAANRAKSTFLANMSHELRTPLNAIIGFSQLMSGDHRLLSEHLENMGSILRSGEHLLDLINDILSLSKIEAGKITLVDEIFDLLLFFKGIEEMFRLRAESRHLNLIFELDQGLPRYVRGDQGKLRQIIINLIGNAVKFTAQGGIAVRVEHHRDSLQVEVEDTGSGISQTEISHLFEPFVQTESGRNSQEGTGLGLAITRNFIRLMGGDITVRSEVGKGTLFRFSIRLPLAPEGPPPAKTKTRVVGLEASQPPCRMLIVDDHPENRAVLRKLLGGIGFEIAEATNGQEAVAAWSTGQPHLIWMDLNMPVMDGYEATSCIRSLEKQGSGHQTPGGGPSSRNSTQGENEPMAAETRNPVVIIALSASAFEQDRSRMTAVGADDFVAKPYRNELIFEKIVQHLGVRFIYEAQPEDAVEQAQPGASAAVPFLPAPRIEVLPESLRQTLSQAALEGDIEAIRRIIVQIREKDSPLGDFLLNLLKGYQLDELHELASKSLGEVRETT